MFFIKKVLFVLLLGVLITTSSCCCCKIFQDAYKVGDLISQGDSCVEKKNYNQAIYFYDKALEISPETTEVLLKSRKLRNKILKFALIVK